MCGRFTRYLPWPEIVRLYRLTLAYEINKNTAPAYNIAPTVEVPLSPQERMAARGSARAAGGWFRGGQGNAEGGNVQRPH
jgi:putative SOS response-associated peptidase YedK